MKRYIAEWITTQYIDDAGDWQPDRDEYGRSRHDSLADAQRAAVKGAKAARVADWCAVDELEFNASLGISPRSDAAWDHARRWTGDCDGNWEEIR